MTILFLHGLNSTPGGIKPTYPKDHGHMVLNPALSDDDFDEAVWIATSRCRQSPLKALHALFLIGRSKMAQNTMPSGEHKKK
jgi:hypothetical protein